ncbi:hypothetical protein GP486_006658 [Trichoglossum hirsutum]|uniref:NACHT domain-containing protein n=1 Tax=Trichoglossum hirsutum TaxID=265104 RepID=A0A9P8IGU9_9PEZI|nr:hypothetical protein GP486_006658 [Trichoglossum hirsutum]
MDHSLRLTYDDYTIACICPMGVELLPLEAMLDEIHQSLPSRGNNSYTLGRMGEHNVVIAVLPEIGIGCAGRVATQLLNDFRSIRFSLLVGTGGGVPGDGKNDIRLGDVVVSRPTATFGGVVQFDKGKIHPNGRFEPTGIFHKPPTVLIASFLRLQTQHGREGSKISRYLSEMLERYPNLEDEQYRYPGAEYDRLFEASYIHEGGETCRQCDRSRLIERAPRKYTTPRIHHGTIGSSNSVVKDSRTRDKLREDLGIICVEMEAAGIADEFPCLVVRGISDYADSHKNKTWQPYAAATAAAYAKELLSFIPVQNVASASQAVDAFRGMTADPQTEDSNCFRERPLHEQDQLNELPCADDAAFNSKSGEHEPQCLPDTRVDLLQEIMMWGENPDGAVMFWLNGMAGTGKSTIARTVARAFADQKRLGASFFFSRGQGDRGRADKFFTTLAAQLSRALPVLKPRVCSAISENFNIFKQGLAEQWRHLIFQPLSGLIDVLPRQRTFFLVVDALDECEGEDDVRLILRLLAEAKSLRDVRLRVFVTSRPEIPIRLGFKRVSGDVHQDFTLHDISQSVIQRDISTFLRHELEVIREDHGIPEGWPEERDIELLAQGANGLFIYAATACRFIRSSKFPPEDRLSLLLSGSTSASLQSPAQKLDEMYAQVLRHSVIGDCDYRERAELAKQFRQIVGPIVILFDALASAPLANLINVPLRVIRTVLDNLRSVLDVSESQDRPIRLIHPSFRDFLLDRQRCSDTQFWIEDKKTNNDIFVNCLELMSNCLKRDICNLQLPGALASEAKYEIEEYLPPDVQYACRYWVYHLQRGNRDSCDLDDYCRVHVFLRKHLLHWLEALSLMGIASDGVVMVRALGNIVIDFVRVTEHKEVPKSLLFVISDVERFILKFRPIIEEAPLQVYSSALVFSPKRSIIRKLHLDDFPAWIKSLPKVENHWSPSLQTLEGHVGGIRSVSFSPDGQLLVSAADDGTIRLWDPSTGALLQTLVGDIYIGLSVAFSPDGQLLASASYDEMVRLWDPSTGVLLRTLDGHIGKATSVAFSSDGQLLASALGDIVVVWDPRTGVMLQTLKGHLNPVEAVAFPSDGQLLASASSQTVKLWDPRTGALLQTFEGHNGYFRSVAISPDGQLLASAVNSGTISLWDPRTGELLQDLEVGFGPVTSVAFSPDGQLLASSSEDGAVRLCNTGTKELLQTFEGHSFSVESVAFSPDGRLLASGSRDKTIKIWDLRTEAPLQAPKGVSEPVALVAFSPDGQLLASASADRAIKLWDPKTGALLRTLRGYRRLIGSVAFSPDGQLLASASYIYDEAVKIWNTRTGGLLHTLDVHAGLAKSVAFSPHGQLLTSAPFDNTISFWDSRTGELLWTLKDHPGDVDTVAFSADGQLLASVSYSYSGEHMNQTPMKIVKLWDLKTASLLQNLESHQSWDSLAAAFSPDGQLLATTSDKTIRLWDPRTRKLLQVFEDSPEVVRMVTFSPNGQLLASARLDTVSIRDIKTGDVRIFRVEDVIQRLSFSSDGSCLIMNHGILDISSSNLLYFNKKWLTWGTNNILWLPPENRQTCMIFADNVLAMGLASGRVTFAEFDLACLRAGRWR